LEKGALTSAGLLAGGVILGRHIKQYAWRHGLLLTKPLQPQRRAEGRHPSPALRGPVPPRSTLVTPSQTWSKALFPAYVR
jgi:hypothetical protein